MKRAGFTMIELVFVIVILGILSAVALPKFIGVSKQAHDGKVKAFVSTLNGTVGPSMWAASISSGANGSVKAACDANITRYVDQIPAELSFNNTACQFDKNGSAGGNLDITFTDGNATDAPTWAIK